MTPSDAQHLLKDLVGESEGFTVFHALMDKFGWSGTVFSPNDARQYIANCREADDLPELSDDELDMWTNEICRSWEWRKGLLEVMTEHGWELIASAYEDVAFHFGRTGFPPPSEVASPE
jgi:hypothetical protein